MPVSFFRAEDGSEWSTWEEAENHERRRRLLSEKTQELGGISGLMQHIKKARANDKRYSRCSFIERNVDGNDEEALSYIADNLEEIVLLAKFVEPILEACGPNPPPLKESW